MTAHRRLTIGLFGFGVVGEGLYKVLEQTASLNATIKKVCIKDAGKKRNAPATLFTTDKNELLDDDSINVIVEVINDSDAAFEIISFAFFKKIERLFCLIAFTSPNVRFNSNPGKFYLVITLHTTPSGH